MRVFGIPTSEFARSQVTRFPFTCTWNRNRFGGAGFGSLLLRRKGTWAKAWAGRALQAGKPLVENPNATWLSSAGPVPPTPLSPGGLQLQLSNSKNMVG